MPAWPRCLTFAVILLAPLGCSSGSAPADPSADASATPHATTTAPSADAAPVAPDSSAAAATIASAIAAMKDRQQCNRVTGCAAMSTLLAQGPAARPAIEDALRQNPKADGHWVVALIDVLGQLGDPAAAKVLRDLAVDPRWEVRLMALRALGRLAGSLAVDTKAELARDFEAMLARPETAAEPSWRGALYFALLRLDSGREAEHQAALVALLPSDAAGVKAMAAPFLDVLVQLAGEARATRALPAIRWAALSENRFVSVHALEVLGRLQDTGGVPFALRRLEDANPTVRRTALTALQQITGAGFETPAQWQSWAASHGLAELPE